MLCVFFSTLCLLTLAKETPADLWFNLPTTPVKTVPPFNGVSFLGELGALKKIIQVFTPTPLATETG